MKLITPIKMFKWNL